MSFQGQTQHHSFKHITWTSLFSFLSVFDRSVEPVPLPIVLLLLLVAVFWMVMVVLVFGFIVVWFFLHSVFSSPSWPLGKRIVGLSLASIAGCLIHWHLDYFIDYLLHDHLFLNFFEDCDGNLLLFDSLDEDRLHLLICFLFHFLKFL